MSQGKEMIDKSRRITIIGRHGCYSSDAYYGCIRSLVRPLMFDYREKRRQARHRPQQRMATRL
jgi:hypothetical protein